MVSPAHPIWDPSASSWEAFLSAAARGVLSCYALAPPPPFFLFCFWLVVDPSTGLAMKEELRESKHEGHIALLDGALTKAATPPGQIPPDPSLRR